MYFKVTKENKFPLVAELQFIFKPSIDMFVVGFTGLIQKPI